MTSNLICRVCLCTDKILREMDDELAEYFEDMCDSNSGVFNLQSCSACEESLRNNFDFTNKCRKANRILQGWRKNKSQKKIGIESLHKLLVRWNDISAEPKFKLKQEEPKFKLKQEEPKFKLKQEPKLKLDHSVNETMDVDKCVTETENVLIKKTNNVTKNEDSKSNICEVNEMNNDDMKSEDNFSYDSQSQDNNELVKDEQGTEKDVYFDYEVLEDDFLEIKADNKAIADNGTAETWKVVEHLKFNTQTSSIKEDIIGPVRKGPKPFTKYESVFNIHLFETKEEVMEEVLRRRVSEPYLSASYRCELCYMVFRYEKLLQFHMKWHDPAAGAFECSACRMRYATRRALTNHQHHLHRGKFSCKICPFTTYYKGVMMKHFLKHQDVEVYKCNCDPKMLFKSLEAYMNHKRSAHPHVCVTCARAFATEGGLTVHRIAMHQTSSVVDNDVATAVRCEPCDLTFASQQVYTVHVLNTDAHKDIANDVIACAICGLSFDTQQQVKEHTRTEHRPKKENLTKSSEICECRVCGTSGIGLRWLYHHHRRTHPQLRYEPPVRRDHLCDQCGRSFIGLSQLREHSRTHTGLRPFRCEQCGKGFRIKQFLVDHMVWHAPPERECTECGKKYHSKAGLYNHMRGHIGDRRYKCERCGAGFTTPAMLREHVRGVHLRQRRLRVRAKPTPTPTRCLNL